MRMRIAIRVDASSEIGTGHLRRCLSIAETLRTLECETLFIVRPLDAVAQLILATTSHAVHWLKQTEAEYLPEAGDPPHAAWAGVPWQQDGEETIGALENVGADWLILDHYAFDARWHNAVRTASGCRLLVIDDLGDRQLSADLVLDPNVAEDHFAKFSGLLDQGTRLLAGARFAPLAPIYRNAQRYTFSPEVRSVGIFLGGAVPGALSSAALHALRDAGFNGPVEIVATSASAQLDDLKRNCDADGRASLSLDQSDLSHFHARHDLQIGAGGVASYERCCIGTPAIAVLLAANQLATVPILDRLGVVRAAALPGMETNAVLPGLPALSNVAEELIADVEGRRELSRRAKNYVDGLGAERIALILLADSLVLRSATIDDAATLHAWRNDPATRSVSINTAEIAYADHLRWLGNVLAADDKSLFVAMIGSRAVGVIRFDLLDDGAWEVSLYMDPCLHGLGLGTKMVLAGEREIERVRRNTKEFRARVVVGNRASMNMFERIGYQGSAERLVKRARQGEGA